jgi:catechol 2,3-dioxygenase-like lactoylglutathione lyase family enzyme
MGYHHLALACKDINAIHSFYEGVLGFELVKVEAGTPLNAANNVKFSQIFLR